MQFTRMLRGASSFASDFVSAINPAFDALSGTHSGLPSLPAIDATFTSRRSPRSIMCGTMARLVRKGAVSG